MRRGVGGTRIGESGLERDAQKEGAMASLSLSLSASPVSALHVHATTSQQPQACFPLFGDEGERASHES